MPHERCMAEPLAAPQLGTLTWLPAADRPDLLRAPVAAALAGLSGQAWVAELDDGAANTAPSTERYQLPSDASAN